MTRAALLPLLGLLLVLVPVPVLAAGPTSALQEGRTLERAGEPAKALDRYLAGLEGRTDRRIARAVESVAPAAVDLLFASTQTAPQELRFADALAVLDRLALLRARLGRRGVEVPRLTELDPTRADADLVVGLDDDGGSAHVVCVDAAAVPGLETVTSTGDHPTGEDVALDIECPGGKKVLAGGGFWYTGTSLTQMPVVVRSGDHPVGDDSWRMQATSDDGGEWWSQAVCATVD